MSRADERLALQDARDAAIAAEDAADREAAAERGETVLDCVDRVISEMKARGYLRAPDEDCRVAIFHAVADAMFGNAAIDVPTLRRAR